MGTASDRAELSLFIRLQKASDSALEKIMKEPSCFGAEQKNVCHITDTGGQGEGREVQD